jgi:hypothetical protein
MPIASRSLHSLAGLCFLALSSIPLAASPAAALSLTLAGPTSGPLTSGVGVEAAALATQLSFAIGLDAATAINGYDLTIAWDPGELAFLSATPVPGLAFSPAPNGSQSTGTRAASITLLAVQTDLLFSVSFDVLGNLPDGLVDFEVFVDALTNGSGIAPGSLSLANLGGAGIDVVPEPASGALLGLGLAAVAAARRARQRGDRAHVEA